MNLKVPCLNVSVPPCTPRTRLTLFRPLALIIDWAVEEVSTGVCQFLKYRLTRPEMHRAITCDPCPVRHPKVLWTHSTGSRVVSFCSCICRCVFIMAESCSRACPVAMCTCNGGCQIWILITPPSNYQLQPPWLDADEMGPRHDFYANPDILILNYMSSKNGNKTGKNKKLCKWYIINTMEK